MAPGLRRTLKWDAAKLKNLSVAHREGVAVKDESAKPGQSSFLYTWK